MTSLSGRLLTKHQRRRSSLTGYRAFFGLVSIEMFSLREKRFGRLAHEFLCGFDGVGCYRLKMATDGELLQRYVQDGAEDSFGELLQRHVDLVYSAALRQVRGDVHLAQDVAQCVFSDLARKARSLQTRGSL